MPDSDFEKQVQQKMDELNFVPSDLVWRSVEKQIKERRKRRRVLLWLPLLVLILSGGAAWMYKNSEGTGSRHVQIIKIKTPAVPVNKNDAVVVKGLDKNEKKTAGLPVQKELVNPGVETTAINRTPAGRRIHGSAKKEMLTNMNAVRQVFEGSKETTAHAVKQKKLFTADRKNNDKPETVKGPAEINETKISAIENNDIDKKPAARTIAPSILTVPDVADKKNDVTKKQDKPDSLLIALDKKPVNKKKKPVEWVITAAAGVSNISNGFSGLFKSSRAFDALNYATASANGNVVVQPSDIKTGTAWSVGVLLRKKYSKTFSLLAGLHYSYYSTKISVGQRTDSTTVVSQGSLGLQTVNGFYGTGNAGAYNYVNHYHFIELPVGIEKQLGPKSHFSFNTGFTVSRLIAGNALHYDAQKNIYYSDNSLFNKTQLGFFGGFGYRLWQKNTTMMEIGPQLQYGFTNLFKKELYGSSHLLFVAVSAKLFLQKK